MKFKILNHSNLNMDQARPFLKSFLPFAKKKMGFDRPVSVIFKSDADNAAQPLGKTAFYDPNNDSVTVYTDGRHLKDILRSLSHELVHHTQNCRGDLNQTSDLGEDYFQKDKYMQEMEREAYEKGNMTFRDWEEKHRKQLKESIYYRTGDIKMNHNDWKNKAIFSRLMENFGYKALNEGDMIDNSAKEETAEADEAAAETKPTVTALEEEKTVTCEEVHPGMDHQQYLEENQLEEAHCGGRREDDEDGEEVMEEELQEDVPTVKASDLDADDIEDGPGDMSVKDGKLVKVANEETIREAVRKAIKKAIL